MFVACYDLHLSIGVLKLRVRYAVCVSAQSKRLPGHEVFRLTESLHTTLRGALYSSIREWMTCDGADSPQIESDSRDDIVGITSV